MANDDIMEVVNYSGGFLTGSGELTATLKGISFSLRRSAMTALVGETGSGKTLTALSMLAIAPRSFRRSSGAIYFEGADLLSYEENELRHIRGSKISMVFQDARAALNPVFTVGGQLTDVCRLHHHVSRKEALTMTEEMLERVRLPEPRRRMTQYPHEFSGGMAQRAQLAMALICRPSLLILDEPTTGLDVTIQADILDLISEIIREDGMSTCLITHDLGVVAETCDYVVVLRDGEVCESGTCESILTDPTMPYTQRLVADSRV
jgi:ABC-type dipeptide/oligopeptide/nickel transport system ATPase component